MNHWKKLSIPFNPAIHEALLQQHHATQFLTMASSAFVPEKKNDSHTSLSFESTLNSLVTQPFDGENPLRLGLRLTDLSISFIDPEGHVMNSLELNKKSKAEVFDLFRKSIRDHGFPSDLLREKVHYTIPEHPLDNGERFSIKDQPSFYENVVYRHNADLILNRITDRYQNASGTRVWPHHFDTSGTIPLAYDDQGNLIKSIILGFAIPDSLVPEPYFYVRYWSSDPSEKIGKLIPFSLKGTWKTPEWQGAVLSLSDLLEDQNRGDQREAANRFFDEGISRIISAKNQG